MIKTYRLPKIRYFIAGKRKYNWVKWRSSYFSSKLRVAEFLKCNRTLPDFIFLTQPYLKFGIYVYTLSSASSIKRFDSGRYHLRDCIKHKIIIIRKP